MSIVERLFRRRAPSPPPRALYAAIIVEARRPDWYREGAVPDTFDGRFDMVAAVMALVLLRLDGEGEAGREPAARLAELFVTDMDGQLRERGIGDLIVGKHIGKMMSALGGRLGAYREGLRPGGDLEGALRRNVYRGIDPADSAIGHAAARMRALAARLGALPLAALIAGELG